MDAIEELRNALNILLDAKQNFDLDFIKDVSARSTLMLDDLTKSTGTFLHALARKQPNDEALKTMIDACPASLSFKDKDSNLPIHTASDDGRSIKYVPMLAREGVRYNIGDGDGRGGLLVENNWEMNVFQISMKFPITDIKSSGKNDIPYINLLKQLKEDNLFLKEDIRQYDLLYESCDEHRKMMFQYLAEIDPQALTEDNKIDRVPLIHSRISTGNINGLQLFLSTALKYHPNDLGLLFQKDKDNVTAFKAALERFGEKETFCMIEKWIPLDGAGTLPILHRVVEHEPDYFNKFGKRYPSSFFVPDQNGRGIQQFELASGLKSFNEDAGFFLRMTDSQVREIDPGSDLYPFMVAACNNASDLGGIYYLLRRNPSLAIRKFDSNVGRGRKRSLQEMKSITSTKHESSKHESIEKQVSNEELINISK